MLPTIATPIAEDEITGEGMQVILHRETILLGYNFPAYSSPNAKIFCLRKAAKGHSARGGAAR